MRRARHPSRDSRSWSRSPACSRSAACQRDDSILLVEVAGDLDADAGAAVGDGDGGRPIARAAWCRPTPTTISLPTSFTVELDRSITGPVTIAIDALDGDGYVVASGATTQTHINTGGQTIIAVTLGSAVQP